MPLHQYRNPNAAPRRSSRRRPLYVDRFEVIGRLVSVDSDRQEIEVEDERSPRSVMVELKGARLRNVFDADGDGRHSVRDLFPGDRVRVITRSGVHGRRVQARTLWRLGPRGPLGGLRGLVA